LIRIPTQLGDLTAEWLNLALSDSEILYQNEIVSVDLTRLSGEGQGFLGQTCRLHLTYESSTDSPGTIVAKISHEDPEILRNTISFFRREVCFYTKVSKKSSVRTPICYYGDIDEDTGESVLLLEDLKDGQIGDMISGGSIDAVRTALDELVKLHVAWWEKAELRELGWVPQMPKLEDPEPKQQLLEIYTDAWSRFSEKFEDIIPVTVRETWEVFTHEFEKIRNQSVEPPLTLCHGDYHLENMAFSRSSTNDVVTVFDWQCLRISQGPLDLCYFMVLNLDPELRREHETEIQQLYVDKLRKAGLTDYSLEQCEHAYKVALYELLLTRMVAAGGYLDTSNDRAQTLFRTILHRTNQAIADYPIQDLI
jgi:aminoglycoside/choline kinase family phosphotransferase